MTGAWQSFAISSEDGVSVGAQHLLQRQEIAGDGACELLELFDGVAGGFVEVGEQVAGDAGIEIQIRDDLMVQSAKAIEANFALVGFAIADADMWHAYLLR